MGRKRSPLLIVFFYPRFPFVLAAYNLTRSPPTERQKQAICSWTGRSVHKRQPRWRFK